MCRQHEGSRAYLYLTDNDRTGSLTFLELRTSIITINVIIVVVAFLLCFSVLIVNPNHSSLSQCTTMCEVDATQGARVVAV